MKLCFILAKAGTIVAFNDRKVKQHSSGRALYSSYREQYSKVMVLSIGTVTRGGRDNPSVWNVGFCNSGLGFLSESYYVTYSGSAGYWTGSASSCESGSWPDLDQGANWDSVFSR